MKLKTVTIRGYKSIANLEEFELRSLNVLIGANGAGKSNFISTFRFLAALANGNLQTFVQQQGGPDALLFGGRKQTRQLDIEVYFDAFHGFTNGYRIGLTPTADNRLIFGREEVWVQRDFGPKPIPLGAAHDEAKLRDDRQPVSSYVRTAMRSWRQYHFHDTGDSAAVKRPHHSNDNLRLKPAADNLAAYLAMLQSRFPEVYRRIVDTIKLAAPFFGDFNIRDPLPDPIELEWFEQTDPDTPYKAHMLSDGTLRFICLATLLLQPETLLPDTVLIDEPELGLHPYAINLLADMLRQVAETKQVIVSTQSVELLNCFTPADVVVAERQDGATTLKRLDADGLGEWLEEYSLGELWKRNILGGQARAMMLVFVVCEGQTEETFVRDVLAPSLSGQGLTLSAKLIETSPGHSGGALNYERVRRALCRFLANKSSPVVTTLFDLHRLDKRFPKAAEAKALTDLEQRLELLATAFHADIVGEAGCRPDRFIPYIQPYEFEALLFSDVATLAGVQSEWKRAEPSLAAIRSQAASPEHINERPNSNPAAHLERELKAPHYRKTLHGPIAAQRIGLSRMEAECAFFAGWTSRLRSLAG